MKLRTTAWRAYHPRWAYDPTSGEGAALYGVRFNPTGQPALYLSLRPQTAWLEAQQAFPFKAQPMTLCAYEIDYADIVDFTNDNTEAGHLLAAAGGFSNRDIACPWEKLVPEGREPPTWMIARHAIATGLAGALFPSQAFGAGPDDINLVLWASSGDQPPHRLAVIDDFDRLPKNDLSWR